MTKQLVSERNCIHGYIHYGTNLLNYFFSLGAGAVKKFGRQKQVNHRAFFPEDHAVMTPIYKTVEAFSEKTRGEGVADFVRAPGVVGELAKMSEGIHVSYER